jgi:hypothetical protein
VETIAFLVQLRLREADAAAMVPPEIRVEQAVLAAAAGIFLVRAARAIRRQLHQAKAIMVQTPAAQMVAGAAALARLGLAVPGVAAVLVLLADRLLLTRWAEPAEIMRDRLRALLAAQTLATAVAVATAALQAAALGVLALSSSVTPTHILPQRQQRVRLR